ncbi:MAG: hypothetical protein PHW08_06415 [Kiritimatiellae bacterium]|nr:hypothetical protein [Kiritimatiellia bacterium]
MSSGLRTALTRSPRPSISTAPPCSSAGTSEPTEAPASTRASHRPANPQRRCSAVIAPAASALPPAIPAPIGTRLTIRMSQPRVVPQRRCIARAAFTARCRSGGRSASAATSTPSPTVRQVTASSARSSTSTVSKSDTGSRTLRRSW